MRRTIASYSYLVALAVLIALLNVVNLSYDSAHPDRILRVAYLALAAAVLNVPQVRIEQGRLSLSGIATGAAALVLNPLDATIIGIASSASFARRGPYPILANAVFAGTLACIGATVASQLRVGDTLGFGPRLLVLLPSFALNLPLVAIAFRVRFGESIRRVLRRNFTSSFYFAFAYFALAALLISYVLDGSALGYFLVTIVW